jgi:hypothetical protein
MKGIDLGGIMNQTLFVVLSILLFHFYNFSMHDELDRNLIVRSPDEISHPYRDSCCAVCVQRVLGDEDELRPSRLYGCVRVGCVLCVGCAGVTLATFWLVRQ